MRHDVLLCCVAFVAGCLILDPLDDVTLGDAAGSGGGGVVCVDPDQNVCEAVTTRAIVGPGVVTVTAMLFSPEFASTISVGTFTGTVDFGGPQLNAPPDTTQGFVVEHAEDGSFRAQTQFDAADAGSRVFVSYNESTGDIVVGGNYTQAGSGCPGSQGLFMNRYAGDQMGAYTAVYEQCQTASATLLEPEAITISDSGYLILVGALDGELGSATSDGVDGFVQEVEPDGTVSPCFLIDGTGDTAIRGVMLHETDANLTLLTGDFSGQMRITFPTDNGPMTDTRDASGTRDLFVVAIDRHPEFPNLDVESMGAAGGNHRLVALSGYPGEANPHLAAMIDGPITIDGMNIPAPMSPSALVLRFAASDANTTLFQYDDHWMFSADALDLTHVVSATDRFHVAGHATGEITVTSPNKTFDPALSNDCQNDAFVISIGTDESIDSRRCGDGNQQLDALALHTSTLFAAALTLPDAATIRIGADTLPMTPGAFSFFMHELAN
jgi:hypothetical protein